MIQLHKLSRAQSQSILVSTFFDALDSEDNLSLSESLRRTLWDLFRLFALTTMETDSYECKPLTRISASMFLMANTNSPRLKGDLPRTTRYSSWAYSRPYGTYSATRGQSGGRVDDPGLSS